MEKTPFAKRIVRPYTRVFDITVVIAAGILFILIAYSSYKSEELNNHMLINQPLVQLENYLLDMDNLAKNAMTNEILINKFSDLRDEADQSNYYAINILDAIETSSILRNITGARSDIFRISLYNNYGDYICSGALASEEEIKKQLSGHKVYLDMIEFASGKKDYVLLKPDLDRWSLIFRSDYISLIRPIMNVYSRDVVGLVEVQKNKSTLINSVYPDESSNKKINIYNQLDEIVDIQADSKSYRVVASARSNLYGWRIDLLEKKGIFWIHIFDIFWRVALGCGVIILLARNIFGRITKQIVQPLEILRQSVESVDVINPTRVDTTDLDIAEVYSVASSFNNLMEKVTLLMEQEKKAHLFALQAQMNPHFLYNILSIVNAAAMEANSEMVIDIVGNLSSMLRYTSAFDNSVVKLKDEVLHTEKYLKLMKARYVEMFSYEITLDPAIKNEIVPKLVIQPLFENCFQHGFSSIEPPYRIKAKIQAEKNGWSIEVQDNGKGFSKAERNSLMSKAEEVELADLKGMQLGGLGVLSCIVRIRIVTGKKVNLEISDCAPRGACLKLSVNSVD